MSETIRIVSRWEPTRILAEGEGTIRDVLERAVRVGADLRGANLSGAYLSDASLSGADLFGAYLSDATLTDSNLTGAYLIGSNLHDADLSGADLSGADLYGANLTGADLTGADLRGADLTGARLDWGSHDLLAELLAHEADTDSRRALACLVGYGARFGWCWDHYLALDHPDREWALDVLAGYVVEGDDAPDALRERARQRGVAS